MNVHALFAIYRFEMARMRRTMLQSLVTPVITTSLYFVVFGSAIGGRMAEIDGVPYGAFIVPGLVMLSLLTESIFNASFGIYMPKFTGTVYEILSAPISPFEIILGYVGAAASKTLILGAIILVTARVFVDYDIVHPVWMVTFLLLTAIAFCLLGFAIGVWADGFEKMQIIPMMIVMPLTFLGGSFYSIRMLPETWQTVLLFNPIVYLVNGFRWSFYGTSDIGIEASLAVILGFMALCIALIWWMFRTGYKLKA